MWYTMNCMLKIAANESLYPFATVYAFSMKLFVHEESNIFLETFFVFFGMDRL